MEISVPRLLLVQVEDFVSSLFAVIVRSPGSHCHSLVCIGFSFCILIGKADWCTKGIDRIYFFISSSFLLFLEVCPSTGHVFAFPNFWVMHPFRTGAGTRSRTGHLVVAWVDEYLSHVLRAKPEPCYGKVNMCYLIVVSHPSWIPQRIAFKGLESKPTVSLETQGIYLKFSIAVLSSFPSMLWLSDPLGWHSVHKHCFLLSGSCWQCENLLSSALCLCRLRNVGKVAFFLLYSKWPHNPTHGQVCHESKNMWTVRTT